MEIRWQAIKQTQLAQKKIQGGTVVNTAMRNVFFKLNNNNNKNQTL